MPSYSAVSTGWAIPATPTDMVVLQGSSTKRIRLVAVIIDGLQTTAGLNKFFLIKRSTLDTTGTFVADSIVPHKSSSPAATAVYGHYTANPGALGTLVGNIRVINVLNPAAASLAKDRAILTFTDLAADEVMLLNINEEFALNFNGAALPPGLSLDVTFIWDEV